MPAHPPPLRAATNHLTHLIEAIAMATNSECLDVLSVDVGAGEFEVFRVDPKGGEGPFQGCFARRRHGERGAVRAAETGGEQPGQKPDSQPLAEVLPLGLEQVRPRQGTGPGLSALRGGARSRRRSRGFRC